MASFGCVVPSPAWFCSSAEARCINLERSDTQKFARVVMANGDDELGAVWSCKAAACLSMSIIDVLGSFVVLTSLEEFPFVGLGLVQHY